jgi:ATP-dependent DNA ligase
MDRNEYSVKGDVRDDALSLRRSGLEAFVGADVEQSRLALSCNDDIEQAKLWLSDAGSGSTDGVVCKRIDGPYLPGERAMIKVKASGTADCVVGGFRYETDSKNGGSLLLGLYNSAGELDHVGFTSAIRKDERADLTRRLSSLINES